MSFLDKIGDFLFGWLIPDPPSPEVQGAELTKAATDAFIPKIYGQVKKHSGTIIFKVTNDFADDDIQNDLLHIIIVWGEAVQSIDKVYVDDIDIASNSDLFVVGSNRYVHARNFPNGMDGYTDTLLTQAGWRATDKCLGKACTYIRLQYANGENTLRSEPNFTADITGTTTSNPSTVLQDYLTADMYGKDLPTSFLDTTAFASAVTTCNTQVEEVVNGGVFRDLFTINTAIDTGNSVFDNVNTILKSMRALMPISNGKLKPIVEKDDPAVSVPILENDINELGEIRNSSKRNRFNRVVVTWRDDTANGTKQEAVYPEKDSQIETDLLAEDNGVLLETSVKLDTCNNYYEALAFAKTYLEISRQQLNTTVTLDLWATIYEVGDIVELTHSIPGFVAKPFRITSITETDYEVELELREHQPAIYDFQNTGLKPTYPDTSNALTRPATPTAVTKTDFYTLNKQVEISWTGTTTRYSYVLRDELGAFISSETISRNKVELRNLELANYTIQIYAINGIGLTSSSPATFDFAIDQEIQTIIWTVYADDDQGTNASLTDPSLPFIGLWFNKSEELTDLATQVASSDYPLFDIWIANGSSRWIYDSGAPLASVGSIGDNYLDTATNDVYTKSPSGWVLTANFGSGDGDGFFSGTANPLVSFGADGNTFLNLTTYELFKKSAGVWVSQGNIKGTDGQNGTDGTDGQNATVNRSGNIVTITAANGSVQVFDGNDGDNGADAPIPTFTPNPDGSVTIDPNTGAATLTIPAGADGSTPVLNVDYFVAGGNYVSNIFTNETSRPATPTGGTFNGSSETFPSGWTDNPTDYTPPSKRWVSTRQYERNPVNGAWSAVGAWSTPSLQAESGADGTDGNDGNDGNSGITVSMSTPNGNQWKRDSSGALTPSTPLNYVATWFQNGVQVATASGAAGLTGGLDITDNGPSLGTGVTYTFSTSGKTATFLFTFQGVTVSASFAVIVDGVDGEGATVSRVGNTVTVTGSNGSVQVFDGNNGTDAPIPTLTDNGNGTYTIDNGNGQTLTFEDGNTPQLGIDYFVEGGDYISNIFINATTRPATPTTGSFNGTAETFPAGWTDNPTDYAPPSKRWFSTRRYSRDPATGNYTAGAWTAPALQGETGDTGDTGITATIETPDGTQWIIDKNGSYSPLSTSSLTIIARFYKNGLQVATGQREVKVLSGDLVGADLISSTSGVSLSDSSVAKTRSIGFVYEGVTASATFAIIREGADGQSATVVDNGNGTYTVTGSNGSIVINDGAPGLPPTVINNGNGTYTITNSDGQSVTFSDGDTPQLGIDYFVEGGNYVSNIFRNATSRPTTPTGGSFNGVTETYPTGWTDNPTDYTPPSKRWFSTRRYDRNATTGAYTAGAWSVPALQAETGAPGDPGDPGDTGITATIETPDGTQWIIDNDGVYSPSSSSSLTIIARFYKNGLQVATGQREVKVLSGGLVGADLISSTSGVSLYNSGLSKTRSIGFVYEGVTASATFAIIRDGIDGQPGPAGPIGPSAPDIYDQTDDASGSSTVIGSWITVMTINLPQGIGSFNQTFNLSTSGLLLDGSGGGLGDSILARLETRFLSGSTVVETVTSSNSTNPSLVFSRTPSTYANTSAPTYSIQARIVNASASTVAAGSTWFYNGNWIARRN